MPVLFRSLLNLVLFQRGFDLTNFDQFFHISLYTSAFGYLFLFRDFKHTGPEVSQKIIIKHSQSVDLYTCKMFQHWSVPYASALITTSWLNLATNLKRLPTSFGILFVMFEEIFLAVSKLLALVVIFLVSFGLGFHILLGEKVLKLNTLGMQSQKKELQI